MDGYVSPIGCNVLVLALLILLFVGAALGAHTGYAWYGLGGAIVGAIAGFSIGVLVDALIVALLIPVMYGVAWILDKLVWVASCWSCCLPCCC